MVGDSFSVTGLSTSNTYKHMKVSVLECDPNSTLAQVSPCADTAVLNNFLTTHANFILHFYFVNALINPNNPTEITHYLEDRNYVPFNFNFGGEVNLYMSRYPPPHPATPSSLTSRSCPTRTPASRWEASSTRWDSTSPPASSDSSSAA